MSKNVFRLSFWGGPLDGRESTSDKYQEEIKEIYLKSVFKWIFDILGNENHREPIVLSGGGPQGFFYIIRKNGYNTYLASYVIEEKVEEALKLA